MTIDAPRQLHQSPIHLRPPRTWTQSLNGVLFLLLFISGCFTIHGFQLLFLLPLKLVPGPNSRKLYDEGIRYTKGAFATLLSASFPEFTCVIYPSDSFRRPHEPMVRSDKTLHYVRDQRPGQVHGTGYSEPRGTRCVGQSHRPAPPFQMRHHFKPPGVCAACPYYLWFADPIIALGLLRLVVHLVFDVLCGHAQGRFHRLKEESQMDPCLWAGTSCLWQLASRSIHTRACECIGLYSLRAHGHPTSCSSQASFRNLGTKHSRKTSRLHSSCFPKERL